MMNVLQYLPNVEPYGTPKYFIYLIPLLLPIFIGLFYKKRFPMYEWLVSLLFLALMFIGPNLKQVSGLAYYLLWQILGVYSYKFYRKRANKAWVFYLHVFLLIVPLASVKVMPAISDHNHSLFGFLGISYLTFKTVGMVMEIRDGTLKDFSLWSFLRFLVFMPTFSSGPIDRFRRFEEDYRTIPEREELMNMLEKAIWFLMLGALYKFILSYYLGSVLLPPLKAQALQEGGFFNLATVGVMYVYGLNLFFDFAGYSMFAVAISYFMGIKSPSNFDKPFLSRDLKEFWNRWHMSLSFWFRDYVFMRLVMVLTRKKVFKNRNMTSAVAYLLNMLLMGLWHGLTWYYIAYGLFHGTALVINDAWLRKKKEINKNRKKAGQAPLPDTIWTRSLGIFLTFNTVMLSFLIFSGFLDKLWF
ncbi:integral membrane protein [Streptococcus varani]|uniref:Teichoic acid D-alanyltransferase n=1 Tax=Streptococcus varani TaxID=1608583 RepID=A0A0E4H405_9STRE|nr:D-alanyl-lipoteichoic acid biosynthesis protein DltB [Streptococcus varani]CQR24269.1 integral membrane protein [Streptococcus varani]